MPPLADALRGELVIVNLGAGGDQALDLPEALRRASTMVEIDAADESHDTSAVHRRIGLKRVIADEPGRRVFRENAYVHCSSLLPPRQELIERYGLEALYRMVAEHEVDVVTLPEALAEVGIARIDYLKTDI